MWPGGGVLPPLLLPLPEVQLMGCPEAPAEAGAEVEDRVQWQIPPLLPVIISSNHMRIIFHSLWACISNQPPSGEGRIFKNSFIDFIFWKIKAIDVLC